MKVIVFLWLALGIVWGQAPTAWTPEFSMQFQTVSDVTPSPDGTKVAWTQTQSVMDADHSEMRTQIFLANADGSHRIQLTRGEKSAAGPQFSPDGRAVYFLSARSGKNNVYRVWIAGGEAEQLTEFKGALGGYELSPDGKTVAFTGYEPPADEEKNKKEKRDFRVVDANPENQSIYVIPSDASVDGKRAQRKLTDGKRHVSEFAWSPDSAKIAFAHWQAPDVDYWTTSELSEVDISSGAVKQIAVPHSNSVSPTYSQDGRYLAFVKSLSEPPKWAADSGIVLMN